MRAMMAALYCGTGGVDIVNVGSFLGIPGGKSWERSFSRYFPIICNLLRSVVSGLIDTSLRGKIIATITDKLSALSKDEIKKATAAYFANKTKNMHNAIKKLGIVVSYDMG